MFQAISEIKEQVKERYRDITEQRLKRYKFSLTPAQKLIYVTAYSAGVVTLVVVLGAFCRSGEKTVFNYSNCTTDFCEYRFFVKKKSETPIHAYVRVNGMPQTHMRYRDTEKGPEPGKEIDCTPYLEDGLWVYPCGIVASTYPTDGYTIISEDGKRIEVSESDREKSAQSWRNPSSFSGALHKKAEIEPLNEGAYTLVVKRMENYPENSRELILVSEMGPFGVVLSGISTAIVVSAVILVAANLLACALHK